jgi:TolB-like protein
MWKNSEGSVRKAGNRVRTAHTADGLHLSETFDRDLNDIFKVQDDQSGHRE